MSPELDDALRRLNAALSLLEASVAQRLAAENSNGDLQTELQIMGDDRARLAAELEGTAERLARLEGASDGVERRLGAAIASVDGLLAAADRNAPGGEG